MLKPLLVYDHTISSKYDKQNMQYYVSRIFAQLVVRFYAQTVYVSTRRKDTYTNLYYLEPLNSTKGVKVPMSL